MAGMTGAVATATRARGGPYRQRIIEAAIGFTVRSGWSNLTMSRLADLVGVSRQTVYNEIGSKSALAEAMVHHELDRFLAAVQRAFERHPDELVPAVRAAVEAVLELAEDNVLLHAIVSATHAAETDLLPLLTTHAGPLLTTAKSVLTDRLARYRPPLTADELAVAIDVVVRVVLSHVMQPSDTPARTAEHVAWVAGRLLGVPSSGGRSR
ncbi:TetR family transcriptional regulator [Saccharomonospora halophila]|uniref:TetR family transcriptional regulator n=1 Tax=Saccharomonospora halophila TaxID=129922 RepID=UPI00036068E5